jgi:cellulose synthase operon protein YhjU
MGLWGFYFFGKLFLFYKSYIKLDVLYNIGFALFLTLEPSKDGKYRRPLEFLKLLAGLILAVALLWHDSWFPPPLDAVNEVMGQGLPSKEYIYSFLLRYYDEQTMLNLGIILAACWMVNKYFRMSTVVMMALIAVVPFKIINQPDAQDITQAVDAFFDSEQTRMIPFKKPEAVGPGFDIVILHVCSLSWDDLKGSEMENDPFWRQFHYMFTNFNTATAYSGPSVIRLLRGACGQPRHEDLFKSQPNECYLFRSLEYAGFSTYATLNHDGKYGLFANQIRQNGLADAPPTPVTNLPLYLLMFDNSAIYDDSAALEELWKNRMASGKNATAIYYNTITLHEGSHKNGENEWWKKPRESRYKEDMAKLFGDITKFFKTVTASGRNVVVVFVPEHGMALRGSVMQVPGLRDIPLPKITTTPLGIKLIGPAFNSVKVSQKTIAKPISYFALSFMLAKFADKSPFMYETYFSAGFLDSIPQTDFVAENDGAMVAKVGSKYYFFGKEKKWMELTDQELQ